jgi:nickel transport protein
MLSGRRKFVLPFVVLLLVLLSTTTALAHGARIDYTVNMAIEIVAAYDSGEPMAEAQVTIYAPDDLETPWLTGTTDDEGRFIFTPDPAIPGTWDVQVRQAGHGDIVHIPVGEGVTSAGSTGFTTVQIILMSACVIWGFVGTALYFSRRKA